ncbi:MAG: hypothetical protein NTV34_04150 [Proteobacteria bacterium]|nr:hypothetical protein [Pseudomonadota bacterium]
MNLLNTVKTLVIVTLPLSTIAFAGNERGGGTSPAPIFMPEDATYSCDVALTQLGSAIDVDRALVSRATIAFSWKKGQYAGRNGVDLKDILDWRHATLVASGPMGRTAEVEAPAPETAIFSGYVAIAGEVGRSSSDIDMKLSIAVSSNALDKNVTTRSTSSAQAPLKPTQDLVAEASFESAYSAGDFLDQRILKVACHRVK